MKVIHILLAGLMVLVSAFSVTTPLPLAATHIPPKPQPPVLLPTRPFHPCQQRNQSQ